MYQKLKNSYLPERYVTQNLSPNLRSCIAQLRFGILPLHVETGRYVSQSREQRVCYLCDGKNVEDEIHFLLFCNSLNTKTNDK